MQSAGGMTTVTAFVSASFFSFMFLFLVLFFLPCIFAASLFVFLSLYFFFEVTSHITIYIFICNNLFLIYPILHSLLQGERCSFSVQMWFYFLCGLRSDLWAALPADLAKEVLGQVLSETLQLLVQRYSKARPSYQRHLQLRYSITCM